MKKTLSLLLALVMVIGLFPVFADEAPALTADEAGAVLQGYGAIKGDSNGDLMIDKELKRQDAVVILTRLMGKDKEVDAMPKETKASFEDITIDYYQPFLAFAESNKWIEGKAEKKFGFNDVVTVKEFSAMLLRALGHDTMGENYAKVMDLAKEQGLFKGAMVEENANLVRGIAFILMNNTLETAPKGEDKALVYKLGYKEEPKPENLTVVSAEAAGLKAIDVKFSKEVDETTLVKIVLKDGNKTVKFNPVLLDAMTARLNLLDQAKQDAKYMITVDGVKSADKMEAVEKYEATIFMTDATRPEVLSAEALNPKTILVKTSEPVANKSNVVRKLDEIKIDGKALYGKILNENKNEVVFELNSALKPGDYKVEVSRLTDYANFIAKNAEFDITVVEDKDAPMVVEAKMINVESIKVVFNEGIYDKGTFKVNGENANPNTEFKKGDKEITLDLTKALDIAAVVEVKVEHKGQKDIMGNTVKDMAKFTFKVEDDTTLPEVKDVSVEGSTVKIEFTKSMLKKNPVGITTYKPVYSLMKDGKSIVKNVAINEGDFNKEGNVLKLAISNLDASSAQDYTLVLEGLKDATVRMNAMPKTEVPFSGKDTQKPTVTATYKIEHKDDPEAYLVATLYFSEEMDEETLLDKKNVTFMNYFIKATDKKAVRADAADVSFTVEDGGKTLVIEATNKEVYKLGNIMLVGLKDKAGNNLVVPAAGVAEHDALTPMQDFVSVTLVEGTEEEGMLVKLVVKDEIPSFASGNEVVQLKKEGVAGKISGLTLARSTDNYTFFFTIDDKTVVGSDAKHTDGTALELEVIATGADKAKSILGDKLANKTANNENLIDKVAPGKYSKLDLTKLSVKGTPTKNDLDFSKLVDAKFFNEKIKNLAGTITGNGLNATLMANGPADNNFKVGSINKDFAPETTYTIDIVSAEDEAGNTFSGKFDFTTPKFAKFVKMVPVFKGESGADANKLIGVNLVFDSEVAVTQGIMANYTLTWGGGSSLDITSGTCALNGADSKIVEVRAALGTEQVLAADTAYDLKLHFANDAKITDKTLTAIEFQQDITVNYTHK